MFGFTQEHHKFEKWYIIPSQSSKGSSQANHIRGHPKPKNTDINILILASRTTQLTMTVHTYTGKLFLRVVYIYLELWINFYKLFNLVNKIKIVW